MITEQDYNILSERVYSVDKNKKGIVHIDKNQEITDGHFQVLEVEDNHSNGIQAMAVASLVS